MPKAIVIVESPAKARTIERYLGEDYRVRACAGHIKDLPARNLGVDVDNDFRPTYTLISGKEKIVRRLKKEVGRLKDVYLAADPDREGEAICQHLAEELNGSGDRRFHRVLFNEITKAAILSAFENPARIDQNKVEAQQARRILDRLVGYKVSPLLWQKVRVGLSAGRVQTVALRLVVEREKEIRAFEPEEYWNFTAFLKAANPPPFEARAVKLRGKKFKVSNQEQADSLMQELEGADFAVSDVKMKESRRRPAPPFITSTLQQTASRRLRFSVKKTMVLAQRLYEGVEMGSEGGSGLITYMRTDSTRVADSALKEVRSHVESTCGKKYLPAKAVVYRSKKGAQDAHEAIRPTSVERTPEAVKPYLDRDAFRLYELIWRRFVASQMNPALFDQTEIEIEAGPVLFKSVGKILKFDGFLKLYGADEEDKDLSLPRVERGERLGVEKVVPEQKFTQPPARYSEATLVKTLEERGIGRPSTYAQIVSVILEREYAEKVDRRFVPTETGEVVVDLLVDAFEEIFDYDYTARLEKDLDEIESGRENWVDALRGFYAEFSQELEKAEQEMKNLKQEEIPTGETCEKCGEGEMVIRWGRFGRFVACSRYPDCKNTREYGEDGKNDEFADEVCEKCGKPMVLRRGRYGEFLACSGYPDCRNTKKIDPSARTVKKEELLEEQCPQCGSPLARKHGRYGEFIACSNYPECRFTKQDTTGVACPDCGRGEIVRRRSRRGRSFYGCDRYPDCKFVMWKRPVPRPCPACQAPYLVETSSKKEGPFRACQNPACDFKESIEPVQV